MDIFSIMYNAFLVIWFSVLALFFLNLAMIGIKAFIKSSKRFDNDLKIAILAFIGGLLINGFALWYFMIKPVAWSVIISGGLISGIVSGFFIYCALKLGKGIGNGECC